jgi:cell division protein FtsB
MITRQRRQTTLSRLWMPLLTAAFLGYFGYHAFSGAFGKWSMDRMKTEAAGLESQLATLTKERTDLERRVALLRPESLDADVVDMEARTQLNMLRPDEVVISFGATQHPAR